MRFLFSAYSKSIRSWEYSPQVSKWFLENCWRYSEKDPSAFDDARAQRARHNP